MTQLIRLEERGTLIVFKRDPVWVWQFVEDSGRVWESCPSHSSENSAQEHGKRFANALLHQRLDLGESQGPAGSGAS